MKVVVADGVASEKAENATRLGRGSGWDGPGNGRDRFPHLWAVGYCFRPGRGERKAKRNEERQDHVVREGGEEKKKVGSDTRSEETFPRACGTSVLKDEGHAAV